MKRKAPWLILLPMLILCCGIIGIIVAGNFIDEDNSEENNVGDGENPVTQDVIENSEQELTLMKESENQDLDTEMIGYTPDHESVSPVTMYVVNCEDYITLRTNSDTSASEITKIPLGASVNYIDQDRNGFALVSYNGNTGYALSQYLSTNPPVMTESSTITMYVVNCNEYITLRKKASTSAAEITKIPLGASVTYLENASNGFYKVSYNGNTGYALSQYLSTTKELSITMYVVNCNEYITLRKTPSTSAAEITKIPLGASVTYLENAGNSFYKVIYNGNIGYALSQYLSVNKLSEPTATTLTVYNCNEFITLRAYASTSADPLTTIPLGEKVIYISDVGNGFYKVSYNGYVGYALASYLH